MLYAGSISTHVAVLWVYQSDILMVLSCLFSCYIPIATLNLITLLSDRARGCQIIFQGINTRLQIIGRAESQAECAFLPLASLSFIWGQAMCERDHASDPKGSNLFPYRLQTAHHSPMQETVSGKELKAIGLQGDNWWCACIGWFVVRIFSYSVQSADTF